MHTTTGLHPYTRNAPMPSYIFWASGSACMIGLVWAAFCPHMYHSVPYPPPSHPTQVARAASRLASPTEAHPAAFPTPVFWFGLGSLPGMSLASLVPSISWDQAFVGLPAC